MSRAVWKFPLDMPSDRHLVSMPIDAKIHCAQIQGGIVTLWATVDIDAEKEDRVIIVVGTGHSLPGGNLRYVDTIQFSGDFVLHIFENIGWPE